MGWIPIVLKVIELILKYLLSQEESKPLVREKLSALIDGENKKDAANLR
jgi:hypothetical protein